MSDILRIGLIKESKIPVDKRVPLSPAQCRQIVHDHPSIRIAVETSNVRKYTYQEYRDAGIDVVDDMTDCDILMGVKEVPVDQLIPWKTYFFFSHTIKMQPYNAKLLRAVLDKKITLIDYELLADHRGTRVIGFGKYAGIVGCYNGFRAWGMRKGTYQLKPAHLCDDRKEMESELPKVQLPEGFRAVITGKGRVGNGALEVIAKLPIRQVSAEEFLSSDSPEALYTVLNADQYYAREDGSSDRMDIYHNPAPYQSTFMRFAAVADMYIACHFWDSRAPFIFTRDDVKHKDWKVEVVADISCDINGPVASTIRPSTIEEPVYGYHRFTEKETSLNDPDAVAVMAVDNLPCELPKDASADFGGEFIAHVLPQLLNGDANRMLERATIARDGKLVGRFTYLQDYADGNVKENA
jgi:alanine dehydrogenase